MKIEINDVKFNELAQDLKTTPENLVKLLIEHAKNMPVQAVNEVIHGKPLENQLTDILDNALPGLVLNDVIKTIVGEHEYIIDDGDYSLDEGIIWLQISFLEGTVFNMGSITLQFGKDPGIVALEYMDNVRSDLDLELLKTEIEDSLDDTDPTFNLDRGDFIELDYNDDTTLAITLQINWKEQLNLPRAAEIDEIMRKIKKKVSSSESE